MKWLNLIALILQLAEAELPAIEGLIAGIKGASAAHQVAVNTAVTAALVNHAAFPGSADASSFPVLAAA